jgi:hypothetical protein
MAVAVALGVMLVVSLLLLAHNSRHSVIRRGLLWPLLGLGPVGIPLVVLVAVQREHVAPFLSVEAATLVMLIGAAFCFAVWVSTVIGYGIFSATRGKESSA